MPNILPSNKPTPDQVLHFTEATKFLENHGRKLMPILGDGNCLFRAFSCILFSTEDYHSQIRKLLMEILIENSDIFSQHSKDHDIKKHVAHMKYDTIWGTSLEILAAASLLELPIYVCAQKSKSLEYHWVIFNPLVTKPPSSEDYFSVIYHKRRHPGHLEICHYRRCHYDVITMLDGSLPTIRPVLSITNDYIDLS